MDRGTILLGDAVGPHRDAAASALRHAGFRVIPTTDAASTLSRVLEDPPEALVLDAHGGSEGVEVCRQIQASLGGRAPPVILVAGKGDVEARVEALRAGAADCLAKPYDPLELVARVETLLRLRRLGPALRAGEPEPRDVATGLQSAISLQRRLAEELTRAEERREPLGLVVIAPDELRALAQQRGAEALQKEMVTLAQALGRVARSNDTTARWGDGELALLLREHHLFSSVPIVERLWHELRTSVDGATGPCIGGAFVPCREVSAHEDLVRMTELALARARREGPGTVCLVQGLGYLLRPV